MFVRKLSALGRVSNTAAPIRVKHVLEHEKKFLLERNVDFRDLLLHAIPLVGMNCGMRFDEVTKVRMDSVKCTKYGFSFSILTTSLKLPKKP